MPVGTLHDAVCKICAVSWPFFQENKFLSVIGSVTFLLQINSEYAKYEYTLTTTITWFCGLLPFKILFHIRKYGFVQHGFSIRHEWLLHLNLEPSCK